NLHDRPLEVVLLVKFFEHVVDRRALFEDLDDILITFLHDEIYLETEGRLWSALGHDNGFARFGFRVLLPLDIKFAWITLKDPNDGFAVFELEIIARATARYRAL